jgi:DNA-binding CsgD family transcriptional regulator
MDPQLVDRIYECAFLPDQWPSALGELAAIATARTGFLFVSKGEIHRFVGSTDLGIEAVRPLVESGVVARTERFKRLLAARHPGFLTEAEIYPAGDSADDLTYRTILYPRGLGHAAATAVTLPTGDSFTIVLEREFVRGPVERDAIDRLNAIRPDIARSATMSARLQLERARATTQVLEALGLAALVFDTSGKVIAANPLIEAMTKEVRWLARDRLSLTDRKADLLLRAAIESIGASEGATARSFPVRGADGSAAMVAHVVPIRLSARDIFVRCAGVLALTPLSAPNAPSLAIVKSLFDLTPAEARVARDLAEGKTVADIASGAGASESTIRSHVRGVLEKTGCNRQTDVVALLAGLSATRLKPI